MSRKELIVKKERKIVPMEQSIENLENSIEISNQTALDFIEKKDFDMSPSCNSAMIVSNVFKPCEYFASRKYMSITAEEYEIAYENFEKLVNKVNEYVNFVPTLKTFARYINITDRSLRSNANENSDRGEVVKKIIDNLSDRLMQNMLDGKIEQIPSIFIAKANFELRDNDNPNVNIVNINTEDKSVSQIIEEFKRNKL